MTLDDLEQLEQKRLKASPGPWGPDFYNPHDYAEQVEAAVLRFNPFGLVAECHYFMRESGQDNHNAAYLAALSPEVVGELIRLARYGVECESMDVGESLNIIFGREEPRS